MSPARIEISRRGILPQRYKVHSGEEDLIEAKGAQVEVDCKSHIATRAKVTGKNFYFRTGKDQKALFSNEGFVKEGTVEVNLTDEEETFILRDRRKISSKVTITHTMNDEAVGE